MNQKNLQHEGDDGNASILEVHQHHYAARPLSVADDEGAQRLFGWPHKRRTYKALGVAMADLPGGKFAVLVADVEAALRSRGELPAPPTRKAAKASTVGSEDDLDLLRSSGLKLVGGGRR